MEWKVINSYPDYLISDNGDVASRKFGVLKPRKAYLEPTGYLSIKLLVAGKYHNKHIHRLVAEAFIANPLGLRTVNHRDGKKSNNDRKNLEWMTAEENTRDMHKRRNARRYGKGSDKNFSKCIRLSSDITPNILKSLRADWATGLFNMASLARKHGINYLVVVNIVKGRTFASH